MISKIATLSAKLREKGLPVSIRSTQAAVQIYMDLGDEDRNLLEKLADDDPAANLNFKDARPLPPAKGARLRREWKGKTYEVVVRDDGNFEYEGEIYRSLSSIAGVITGTHWNGKKFFGVK